MSTYWDIRCLDCNAESGLHLNHGDDICRRLIPFRNAFAALAESETWVTVPGERGHVRLLFFKDHAAHVLAAVSEYGDIDGDCGEPKGRASCRALIGHEGDHDFQETSPWDPGWLAVCSRAAERRRPGSGAPVDRAKQALQSILAIVDGGMISMDDLLAIGLIAARALE